MSFKKHLEQVCSSGYMFTNLSMIQILIHVNCPQITMPIEESTHMWITDACAIFTCSFRSEHTMSKRLR